MGLIKNPAGDAMTNQQQEYFRCEAIPANVLVMKGRKSAGCGRTKTGGNNHVIKSGAVLSVAEGQCMMIVDHGKILECAAEPGVYTYDASTESSCFCGDLDKLIPQSLRQTDECSGPSGKQKVYYFNIMTLTGNSCVTPNPVPFRVVDKRIGLDDDISLRCVGEFSYRICDPMLFYKHVCGDVNKDFYKDSLDGQLKTELLSALDAAFAKISQIGIPYSELTENSAGVTDALNEILSSRWRETKGLELISFSVSNVRISEEDQALIKKLQKAAALRNMNSAVDHAFEKENLMRTLNLSRSTLCEVNAQENSWRCSCGHLATGKFCTECGGRPGETGWKCSCGMFVRGKYCPECGTPRLSEDISWRCFCGNRNSGNYCPNCGRRKPKSFHSRQDTLVLTGTRRYSR